MRQAVLSLRLGLGLGLDLELRATGAASSWWALPLSNLHHPHFVDKMLRAKSRIVVAVGKCFIFPVILRLNGSERARQHEKLRVTLP